MIEYAKIPFKDSDYNRFWSKVRLTSNPDKCWEWNSGVNPGGYGNFKIADKTYSAHRIAYFLYNRKDTNGLFICHKCDNRKCCNPNHFFLGTSQDNTRDRDAKNRQAKGLRSGKYTHPELIQMGSKHGMSKLTESDVLEIRKLYFDGRINKRCGIHQSILANKYGVSQNLISKIIKRQNWSHI